MSFYLQFFRVFVKNCNKFSFWTRLYVHKFKYDKMIKTNSFERSK